MELNELCKAFGNPERVRLVACLAQEATVSDLLEKCALSQSALSQHPAVLRHADMVRTRTSGRHVYYKTASRDYVKLAQNVIALTT